MNGEGELFRTNARTFGGGGLLNHMLERRGEMSGSPPEILVSRSGVPTLKVGAISLHSSYDPVREGKAWAGEAIREETPEDPGYAVAGLGLGYHVWALLEQTSLPVFVLETDLRRLALAWEQFDWTRYSSRIRFFCDPLEARKIPRGVRLLSHAPSERLDPDRYEEFRKIVSESRPELRLSLNILVVPPIYGGSFPIAQAVYRSLLRLGHRASFLDLSPFEGAVRSIGAQSSVDLHKMQLRGLFQGFLDELILARLIHEKPDLVIALAQAPLSVGLLTKLKTQGVPVAYWFVEDFRLATYWESIAGLVTDFAVIQKEPFLSLLNDRKINHATYLPMAADPSVFYPFSLSVEDRKRFGAPVSFMGAGYYNRHQFLKHLVDFDLAIFGTEWNHDDPLFRHVREGGFRLTSEETAKVFNGTRVNVNLHSSVYHRGVNPEGDFVNPRTFEIASCGAFQIVDRRTLFPELLGPDSEIPVYKDEVECRKLVSHYLPLEDERREMGEKARKRILQEHTYDLRMESWIQTILERGVRPSKPAFTGRWPVEGLIREAGDDNGLVRFLESYRSMGAVNLDDLVRPISAGKGEISPEAATFLLLKEMSGGS
ncbi:MAG: CgeB family protein [Leptospirales bacterium]